MYLNDWWFRNKKKKLRYWIYPLLKDKQHSSYVVAKELTADEDKFQSFYRMSQVAFHRLVQLVEPHISKKNYKLKYDKYNINYMNIYLQNV